MKAKAGERWAGSITIVSDDRHTSFEVGKM